MHAHALGRQLGGERGRTNNLISPRFDPVSKEPDLTFAVVEVQRHVPPSRRIVIIGGGAAVRAFVDSHLRHRFDDTIEIYGEEPHPIYNRVLLPHLIKRKGLLPPATEVKRVEGRLICSCNQVGDGAILRAIREESAKGACELKTVCAATRAGTSCGSCRPEVQKLIAAVRI